MNEILATERDLCQSLIHEGTKNFSVGEITKKRGVCIALEPPLDWVFKFKRRIF
jgi:hypothetical protein